MRNQIYGLYCTCESCPGEIKYVGKTTVSAQERFYRHRWNARNGLVYPVYAWMRKHGIDNIKVKVLASLERPTELDAEEIKWIDQLGTLKERGGYNLVPGGGGTSGYTHSPDAKTRISRKASDKTRKLISEANKKRIGDLSARATISEKQVSEIKKMMWRGYTMLEITKETGIPKSTLSGISHGGSWGHVPWPIGPRAMPKTGRFKQGVGGEDIASSKLSPDKVREIRRRYDLGERAEDIAKDFGVTRQNVGYVGKRVTWKSVPEG